MTRPSLVALVVVFAAAPGASAVEPSDLKPGLIATYTAAPSAALTRLDPAPAFTLKAGESIHPRLAGVSAATWTGYVNVVRAGKYSFGATVQGKVKVSVGGKTVLDTIEVVNDSPDVRGREVDLPGGKKVALGEGSFFGEMALLGNATRNANITTTGVTRLLVLDLVDFRLLMARHPDLGQTIDAEAKRRALENK